MQVPTTEDKSFVAGAPVIGHLDAKNSVVRVVSFKNVDAKPVPTPGLHTHFRLANSKIVSRLQKSRPACGVCCPVPARKKIHRLPVCSAFCKCSPRVSADLLTAATMSGLWFQEHC